MGKAMLKSEAADYGVRFMVGRDADGRWVVSDRDGLVGGLFTNCAAAVHFAMFESGHVPGAVCCVPETETLSLGAAFDRQAMRREAAGPRLKVVGQA